MKKKKKGFTIVELIVVMAIIAILTLMAVPRLQKYIEDAKLVSTLATADTIYNAAVAYEASHITDKNLWSTRANGYIDLSAEYIPPYIEDMNFVPLGKSLLEPYISGDVSFVMGNMPSTLNNISATNIYYAGILPNDYNDLSAPIAVYYRDIRMPTTNEIIASGLMDKFYYHGTAVVGGGEPMVVNVLGFPGATAPNYLVPVSEYLAAYNKEIKK